MQRYSVQAGLVEKWLDELLEQARKEGQGKAKEGTDSGGQVRTVQYSKEDRAGHGQRRDRYRRDTVMTPILQGYITK